MPLSRWHLDRESITSEIVKNLTLKKGDLNPKSIQFGTATVSLGFAAAGVETVSATIAFPEPFDEAPSVVLVSSNLSDLSIAVASVSPTSFVLNASDVGTDYTTSRTVKIYWMAVE